MYLITGAAGFIGSCLVSRLNKLCKTDLIVVDDFSDTSKQPNLADKKWAHQINRDELFTWLQNEKPPVNFVFHLGARTDTTEFDESVFEKLNVGFSKKIWQYCTSENIPLVYASSAATYGNGEFGYTDDHNLVEKLAPLNPYGRSKNDFDKWALAQTATPPHWYGLKFFNVFGPNEYHKRRMASVILHAFRQISENGKLRLFRSHRPDFENGKQLRDFIFVEDILNICLFFESNKAANGLYNAGTGTARTFLDLAHSVFHSMGIEPSIEFIDTPIDIRGSYQYFTEANMTKLHSQGFSIPFTSLEAGIETYVKEFLKPNRYF